MSTSKSATKHRHPLFETPRALDSTDVALTRAASLYNGMIRHELYELFPADLGPAVVHEALRDYRDAVVHGRDAGQAETGARASRATAARSVADALPRLGALVNGNYPPGSPQRSAFFPPGAARQSDGAQLRALLAGLRKYPLPSLPADLSLATLEAMLLALGDEETQLDARAQTASAARVTRENLRLRVTEIRDRLGAVVIGYFGRYNPAIADFGLTVRAKKRKPRTAKKSPATPPGDPPKPA